MKKFRFRMEKIFRLRKEEERQAQMEVQRLRLEESRILERIRSLTAQQELWTEAYNRAAVHDGSESVLLVEQYLVALDNERQHQELELQRHQEILARALKKLEEAHRARRQIEHLRDIKKQEYDQESRWAEQKDLGEIAVLRYVQNKNEERRP